MNLRDFKSSVKLGVTRDYEKNLSLLEIKYKLYFIPNKTIKPYFTTLSSNSNLYEDSNSLFITFNDDQYQRQVRAETWERIERNAFRLNSTRYVIDNIFEGEQISLIW